MQICLVEPFYGGSHRAWADGYRSASNHDVNLVTLPAENWRWRMRGSAIALAEEVGRVYSDRSAPDVVMASSLIDLALFRELTNRHWGRPPTVLYMHENQLGYPSQRGTDPAYPWINWTSLLAADQIWFNSRFHLDSLMAALPEFLMRFPDGPHDGAVGSLLERSVVMPPGVELSGRLVSPLPRNAARPRLLWNHRWEHDKRPDRFAELVRSLDDVDFDVVICGEEPLGGDPLRDALVRRLGDRLVWLGFAARDRYVDLLRQSDVVLSVADHEYFGIAAVEAMAAGCCPVFPERLSYPELVDGWSGEPVLYTGDDPIPMLRERLSNLDRTREVGRAIAPTMSRHDWRHVAPRYDQALNRLGAGS